MKSFSAMERSLISLMKSATAKVRVALGNRSHELSYGADHDVS